MTQHVIVTRLKCYFNGAVVEVMGGAGSGVGIVLGTFLGSSDGLSEGAADRSSVGFTLEPGVGLGHDDGSTVRTNVGLIEGS